MAKIVLNPRVPNRIRTIDWNDYSNGDHARAIELANWYENGDLIIVAGRRLDAGRDVISRVSFPNRRGANKLILHVDPDIHGDPVRADEWEAALESLPKSGVGEQEFRDAVAAANADLMTVARALFPSYPYEKYWCIYNLTEMLAHNMHFDSPAHADSVTQLRSFVNMDQFPRIWRLGAGLEEMARNHYRSAKLHKTMRGHIRWFTRETTLSAYGDRYESGAHPYPMHSIAFQPGEIWFLNPNMLAHEVIYGRRILDGVFLFPQSGLQDPGRYYPEIVDRIHREKLGPIRYHWHKWRASRS